MTTIWEARGLGGGCDNHEGRVHNLNFDIVPGEKVALIGVEHCGRNMLLRLLAGLRPMREGSLRIFSHQTRALPYYADWDEIIPVEIRRKMGIALERDGLLSNVSVREGLELLYRFKYGDHSRKLREGATKVVNGLCQRFGLEHIAPLRPVALAPAERRLVTLARAFLSKPLAILLENPSQDIGDLSRENLLLVLERIFSDTLRTVVASTDDFEVATRFCPRWMVLDRGKLLFDGPWREFLASGDPLAQRIVALKNISALTDKASMGAA